MQQRNWRSGQRNWRSSTKGRPFAYRTALGHKRRLAIWIASIFVIGIAAAGAQTLLDRPVSIGGCRVTDGDTIRCGDERIRLLGIDAPEMPGHCRAGRHCVEGDPYASSTSLGSAMGSVMIITRVGTDRYGRTLALVRGPSGDLSCWQLAHHQAMYRGDWDNGARVARTCPGSLVG
jgi:hypothetical protein